MTYRVSWEQKTVANESSVEFRSREAVVHSKREKDNLIGILRATEGVQDIRCGSIMDLDPHYDIQPAGAAG